MTGNVIAWLASVDWGAAFAGIGLAVTAIGGAAISLYRQWKLTSIEIRERERLLRESLPDKLNPDATHASAVSPNPQTIVTPPAAISISPSGA